MTQAQTALITGASFGIGKELARQFLEHGYNVVAVASKEGELAAAGEELNGIGDGTVTTIACDLTRPEAPQELYDDLKGRSITCDVLVNNAGVGQHGLFQDNDLADEIYIIRLDVEAVVRLSKLFLRDMLARGDGKILNVSSVAGFQPGPRLAIYHAAKAFVLSFSESLTEELADSKVSVTCLCPGPTDTDFFRKADMENAQILDKAKVMSPEQVAAEGYDALMRGDRVHIPGISNKVLTFTRRLAPQSAQAKMHKKLYEIKEEDT